MTVTLLRRDLLEDERRWAFIFGGVATVVALLVSSYEDGFGDTPMLLVASAPAVAGYWIRGLSGWLPAWSMPVLAVASEVSAAFVSEEAEGHAFLVLIALFYSFFREVDRRKAIASLILAVPVPTVLFATALIDSDGWVYWTMGFLVCSWFGVLAYNLRLVTSELEQERNQATERAIAQERRLIARDVHDLVGHSLSVMILHVGAARRAVLDSPEQATANLSQAENVGREAMAEIRRTISLLADADHHQNPGSEPLPGLTDLESLVEQYREAGLRVDLVLNGDPALLEGPTSLAGYRIVQEAMVNASKHAIGGEVKVKAIEENGGWTIRIANTAGRSARTTTTGGQPVSGRQGMGLVGMNERARSVGGSLEAGPTANGWLVEAILPGGGS